MRKLDTEQTNWAIEAYKFVSSFFDDERKPRDRDAVRGEGVRLDQRDTPPEEIDNPFVKLVNSTKSSAKNSSN